MTALFCVAKSVALSRLCNSVKRLPQFTPINSLFTTELRSEKGSDRQRLSMSEQFKNFEVVPDVIANPPATELKVVFDSGVQAELGNVLTPTLVKDPPKLSWEYKPNSLYTLIKIDPDAPSRKDPIYRQWEHWLITNIPNNDVNKGDTLAEYIGAGPPPKTGLHRYVYLIFEQPNAKKFTDAEHGHLTNRSAAKRGNFNIQKFINKHQLGDPIAGNFYQAEYDDYVPILYKQLEDA